MAEALTNSLARNAGIGVCAISAGTVGGKALNPAAVIAMEEIGISMAGHVPKLITQEMVDCADRIISMGCGVDAVACPARFILTEDWGLDDPAGESIDKVREVRQAIHKHVDALLLNILNSRASSP